MAVEGITKEEKARREEVMKEVRRKIFSERLGAERKWRKTPKYVIERMPKGDLPVYGSNETVRTENITFKWKYRPGFHSRRSGTYALVSEDENTVTFRAYDIIPTSGVSRCRLGEKMTAVKQYGVVIS